MRALSDKLILFFISSWLYVLFDSSQYMIAVMLIMMIMTLLLSYIKSEKIRMLIVLFDLLSCVLIKGSIYYIPIIYYDIVHLKNKTVAFFAYLFLIICVLIEAPIQVAFLILFLSGLSILLEKRLSALLFLTTFADDEYIIKALKLGTKGYILKQNFESIIASLKTVYARQSVFGQDIITKIPALIQNEKTDFGHLGLTEKECDLMILVADGMSNKEIAAKLYLSEGTVRNQISILLEKLDLRDRTQLAIFYYKNKQGFA